jgi:hypothetical protein
MPTKKKTAKPSIHEYLLAQIPKVLGMFEGRMTPARLASNLGDPEKPGSLIDQAHVDKATAELLEAGVLVMDSRSLALKEREGDIEVLPRAEPEPETTAVAVRTPEQIAEANFKEAMERAELVKKTYENAKLDFTTEAGQKAASEGARQLVAIRVRINDMRLGFNESARAEIKANDAKAKAITDMLAPVEARIAGEVQAWRDIEKEKAEAKKKAAEEERMRIERAVAAIRDPLMRTDGMSADDLAALLQDITNQVPQAADFGDRFGEATMAHDYVLRTLEERRAEAERREEAAAQEHATSLMNGMRGIVQRAIAADSAKIAGLIGELSVFEKANFEPLHDEGVALYDRLMVSLRTAKAQADQAAEHEKQRELDAQAERDRQALDAKVTSLITRINTLTVQAGRGSVADVDAVIGQVESITLDPIDNVGLQGSFNQAKESAAELLKTMRTMAEDRERAQRENEERLKQARDDKAEQDRKDEAERRRVGLVDTTFSGIASATSLGVEPSVERVQSAIDWLDVLTFVPDVFLDRFEEANKARDAALAAVRAEMAPAQERARLAAEAEKKRVDDQRKADAKSALDNRVLDNAGAIYTLLTAFASAALERSLPEQATIDAAVNLIGSIEDPTL